VFGRFSDGCTSAYWKQGNMAYMGQNWDVSEIQSEGNEAGSLIIPTVGGRPTP
jgi:hypothetical protein